MDQLAAQRLFDDSAETYDRVNSIVSLGLDARWRDWAARQAVVGRHPLVLDAFAGTGRVGLRAAELGANVTLADISPEMLAVARRRADAKGLKVHRNLADLAGDSPDVGGPYDAVTVMWGLRYLDNPAETLRRLASLIVPSGRIVVVDFVEPSGSIITQLAALYFFHILPWIAGTLAGNRELYRELVATTHEMGNREHLVSLVHQAGLEVERQHVMGFGLVVGIVAKRPRTPVV
jgi:demethylmenaquinone methyltransferase/2-methoxy-6-polyprenyl-1,4-benzoquinol methylase